MTADIFFAPAKVNLALHITGRKQNGFHNLSSLIAFTDIGDELTIFPSEDNQTNSHTLQTHGIFAHDLPPEHKTFSGNIIGQAVKVFEKHITASKTEHTVKHTIKHWHIELEKNLPIAAGLGGGSSDAAATLRFLAEQYEVDLFQDDTLHDLLAIGSELPICLHATPHLVEGIGEVLTPVTSLPPYHIILINPMKSVSTPQAFTAFKESDTEFAAPLPKPPEQNDFAVWEQYLQAASNTLYPVAREICPKIEGIIAALSDLPTCRLSRMSGSGATCFGLFHTQSDAEAALTQLRRNLPDYYWMQSGIIRQN